MTHPLETMLPERINADNRMWQAGYDVGFEEGRRQAMQAMQAMRSLADISATIDALAEPISRGAAARPRMLT